MTCQETDYLRELDLFDFPANEERFAPRYQPAPMGPSFNTPFPQRINAPYNNYSAPVFRPQAVPNHDDMALLAFDFDDRALFDGFDEAGVTDLANIKTESRSYDTIELFDNFDSASFGKRQREVKVEQPENGAQDIKKRKLTPSVYSMPVDSMERKFKSKQKRTKWMTKEVQQLWEGIATYGNNWRLIKKKSFGHRTYYQVKDKGRRILSSQGWSSGRTKATHDGAAEEAKLIAEKVLASGVAVEGEADEKSQGDDVSNVGSSPSPTNEFADFELDF